MSSKSIISFCALVGGVIGGFIPTLWGADIFSLSPILFSGLGGFLGIWLGFKMTH